MPAMGLRLGRSVGFSPLKRLPHGPIAAEAAPTCKSSLQSRFAQLAMPAPGEFMHAQPETLG
jgi:hypothetical protein